MIISKDEDELTRLVYSTSPDLAHNKLEKLDFPGLAKEYKSQVNPLLTGSSNLGHWQPGFG